LAAAVAVAVEVAQVINQPPKIRTQLTILVAAAVAE
jgi:hypothetical protein